MRPDGVVWVEDTGAVLRAMGETGALPERTSWVSCPRSGVARLPLPLPSMAAVGSYGVEDKAVLASKRNLLKERDRQGATSEVTTSEIPTWVKRTCVNEVICDQADQMERELKD